MRTFFLTLLIMCWASTALAQQSIHYTYDATGNRTGRSIFSLMLRETDESDEEQRNTESRMTGEWKVIAAPNPTHGLVQVHIQGLHEFNNCILTLIDVTGRTALTETTSQRLVTLDMTALADGLYLLRADIDGTIVVVKIIKEK